MFTIYLRLCLLHTQWRLSVAGLYKCLGERQPLMRNMETSLAPEGKPYP